MPEKKRRTAQSAKQARRAKLRRKRRIRRAIWRSVLSLLTVLVLIVAAALCAGYVGFRGPSQTVGDLLTVSMLETSALKFVPRIYYSEAKVQEIVERNSIGEMAEETNTSLIVIAPPTPEPSATPDPALQPEVTPEPAGNSVAAPTSTRAPIIDENGIQIYELWGGTYHGYMAVVQDPSRVTVGTCRDSFNSSAGLVLDELAKRYDAVAAINGGAFADTNGGGNGGQPTGLVVSEGKLMHKADTSSQNNLVIGFTQDDILVFGKWTTEEAAKWNIRDAVAFGPALVLNGEPVEAKGISSGLNPRTAIGQRADGAVLMLVIEGRQANSLGATYADLIKIMVDFEAVNAANLDGGSSSMLYYDGEYVTNGVVLTGSRKLPTAFIVR